LPALFRCGGTNQTRGDQVGDQALEEGQVVGVFPEGTRAIPGDFLKHPSRRPMLAAQAKVPMLPLLLLVPGDFS
jgi:1-acyl-sn-glycerol-3-phosphate acyltransferase